MRDKTPDGWRADLGLNSLRILSDEVEIDQNRVAHFYLSGQEIARYGSPQHLDPVVEESAPETLSEPN